MSIQREHYLNILKELLLENLPADIQVYLFGSSARGNTRRSSDIDIGLWASSHGPIDKKLLAHLREKTDLSTIPYSVDIVDFSMVSENFRTQALKDSKKWKE